MQLYNGVGPSSGIFGTTWTGLVTSNLPAVHWQQVRDTAAALGLGWEGKEHMARLKILYKTGFSFDIYTSRCQVFSIFASSGIPAIHREPRPNAAAVSPTCCPRIAQ